MSLRFPIAASCEAAVHAPLGWGERVRDATAVAGSAVDFATELFGPAFTSQSAARTQWETIVDASWCTLRPVAPPGSRPPPPARPVNADGLRWPPPPTVSPTLWRLSVSYWKVRIAAPVEAALPPARRARRERAKAQSLDGAALDRLARQPLRPFRAQQPLDVGLFETRFPESPDVIVADE